MGYRDWLILNTQMASAIRDLGGINFPTTCQFLTLYSPYGADASLNKLLLLLVLLLLLPPHWSHGAYTLPSPHTWNPFPLPPLVELANMSATARVLSLKSRAVWEQDVPCTHIHLLRPVAGYRPSGSPTFNSGPWTLCSHSQTIFSPNGHTSISSTPSQMSMVSHQKSHL